MPSYADTRIGVGVNDACAIRTDNTVVCWGGSSESEVVTPKGLFLQISADKGSVSGSFCGVQLDNTISCWGTNNIPAPSGKFLQVSIYGGVACAIRVDDKKLTCWDKMANLYPYGTVPDKAFSSITLSNQYACGILTNGYALCWGGRVGTSYQKDIIFSQLALSRGWCGLKKEDSSVSCFLESEFGGALSGYFQAKYSQISSSDNIVCGIRNDTTVSNLVTCSDGSTGVNDGDFVEISTGSSSTCGIKQDNSVKCWSKYTTSVTSRFPSTLLSGKPTADFTITPTGGSSPLTIQLDASNSQNGSGVINKYQWTITPQVTKYIENSARPKEILLSEEGVYSIKLIIEDSNGYVEEVTKEISVAAHEKPSASFTIDKSTGIAPLTVQLDAGASKGKSTDYLDYFWEITDSSGDTTTLDNKVNPSFTFWKPDTYTIELRVRDEQGVYGVVTKEIKVSSNEKPSASFSVDKSTGIAPLTVQLDAGASKDMEGGIANYLWKVIGTDITIEDTVKPLVTFKTSGNYTVELIVKDEQGLVSDKVSQQISVKDNQLTASFTVNGMSDSNSFISLDSTGIAKIQLDASSSSDDTGIESYQWTILDQSDNVISTLTGVTPNPVTFKSPFSDGQSFYVTVSLETKDKSNQSVITKKIVSFNNDLPVAKFTASPTSGIAPLDVQIDSSESTDIQGIEEYIWKIKDSMGVEVPGLKFGNQVDGVITFPKPGYYRIELVVKDKLGTLSNNESGQSINVSNSPPIAKIKLLSGTEGKIPFQVKLDASDSTDQDGKIQSYSWSVKEDFIVIDNAKAPKPFTLSKAGTYTVVLTVTDDQGATSSTEQTIIAQAEDNRLPVAKIKAQTSTQGVAPLTVLFDGSSSSDVDGQLTDYEWMVSDGRESVKGNNAFPSLLFNRVGDYTITLKVTDNSGGSSTDTMEVTVTDGCVATYSPESGNGQVHVPCVFIKDNPFAGYEVVLRQHNFTNAFLFDLSVMSSTDLKTTTLPDESKCKAVYSPSTADLHIPCIKYGDKSFDVYLLLRSATNEWMSFELDYNRVK